MIPPTAQQSFENQYQAAAEPWDYSASGAEKRRHQRVLTLARQWVPRPGRVLDVGCSLGQFTRQLAGYAPHVLALDISPTAVQKCRANLAGQFAHLDVQVATLVDVPLPAASVDVVFYLDGIVAHELHGATLAATLRRIREVLAPGGVAIFTDYLGHQRFAEYRHTLGGLGLEIVHDEPLNDRLWFQLKSVCKLIAGVSPVRALLRSEKVAAGLAELARYQGERGSKHLCLIARKAAWCLATGWWLAL